MGGARIDAPAYTEVTGMLKAGANAFGTFRAPLAVLDFPTLWCAGKLAGKELCLFVVYGNDVVGFVSLSANGNEGSFGCEKGLKRIGLLPDVKDCRHRKKGVND